MADLRSARRVVLLAGPSGSGKSPLARASGLPVITLDDFYRDGARMRSQASPGRLGRGTTTAGLMPPANRPGASTLGVTLGFKLRGGPSPRLTPRCQWGAYRRSMSTYSYDTPARRRLVRPRGGRVITGVCAGLAKRFNLSTTAVRVIFLLLIPLPGPILIIYLALWLIMPNGD